MTATRHAIEQGLWERLHELQRYLKSAEARADEMAAERDDLDRELQQAEKDIASIEADISNAKQELGI